jgi:hypothetical protein
MSTGITPAKTDPAPGARPPEQKTLWETVITSTPIIMTIVATLMAGMSSSQMTQAQYHRALAAQNQSKTGDQWAFFQARRIRSTVLETSVEQFRSQATQADFKPVRLKTIAERLPKELASVTTRTERLQQAIKKAQPDLGPPGERLSEAVKQLQQALEGATAAAPKVEQAVTALLKRKDAEEAFPFLNSNKLPFVGEAPPKDPNKPVEEELAAINPDIPKVMDAIERRAETDELRQVLKTVKMDQVTKAIDLAEARGAAFNDVCAGPNRVFGELRRQVSDLVKIVAAVQSAAEDVDDALSDLPNGDSQSLADVRAGGAGVVRAAESLGRPAHDLNLSFTAARNDFNARRYTQESRYNQAVAGLLEIQVRKNAFDSDKHLESSQILFLAMLAAQAGVTIGTFALAVRQKSVLWGLATLAGLASIVIAGYVFKGLFLS